MRLVRKGLITEVYVGGMTLYFDGDQQIPRVVKHDGAIYADELVRQPFLKELADNFGVHLVDTIPTSDFLKRVRLAEEETNELLMEGFVHEAERKTY